MDLHVNSIEEITADTQLGPRPREEIEQVLRDRVHGRWGSSPWCRPTCQVQRAARAISYSKILPCKLSLAATADGSGPVSAYMCFVCRRQAPARTFHHAVTVPPQRQEQGAGSSGRQRRQIH